MTRRAALRAVLSPRVVLGTALDALLIGTLCLLWLTQLYWGRPYMRVTDEWMKFTFFVPIAVSVSGAAWLCSLGLAAWHRPLDRARWRVATQALITGALVSFVAGALFTLAGLSSAPLISLMLLPMTAGMAVIFAAVSGLLPVVGFLTNRSAAWVRRCSGESGGDDHSGGRAIQGE
ncbi:hypothetical protein [Deinococcus soli (ex Cha et al. 2016)]|uniref:Uncharacterized protein n=1 Tax=Deinococcus soli (ex Cha et al. 2016) TaxID=1309411 RepID=A0A0F7JRF9_9DEIO|nr:hypothetical protein [Deinococcus soli (ex Cha et al. 2016)]AKH17130.1 hypothetical protein SY84_08770 [Deinococcus soli (ex Cha et al. 2016)]